MYRLLFPLKSCKVISIDIFLSQILDLTDGCYTAYPLLAAHPLPVTKDLYSEDSDIQYDHQPIPDSLDDE